MAKKGGDKHLKRLSAPITYKIPRKTGVWTIKASPGPHPADRSIPIAILIRDILRIASTLREVKYILRKGYVKVDEKIVRDYKYPVGLMDVIEFIPENKFYRILPHKINLLYPYEVNDLDKFIKPLQIKRKIMVKGGKIQITVHDGRNFIFSKEEEYYSLKPGDSIIYKIDSRSLGEYIKLEPGNLALVTGGSKIGKVGKIHKVEKLHPLKPKIVRLESDKTLFETIIDYVFPIGKEKPIINLPGD